VNDGATACRATLDTELVEAREVDLLGRPGDALTVTGGRVTLDLVPWEIRTVQVR
jgi:hypothetical protein